MYCSSELGSGPINPRPVGSVTKSGHKRHVMFELKALISQSLWISRLCGVCQPIALWSVRTLWCQGVQDPHLGEAQPVSIRGGDARVMIYQSAA